MIKHLNRIKQSQIVHKTLKYYKINYNKNNLFNFEKTPLTKSNSTPEQKKIKKSLFNYFIQNDEKKGLFKLK
jgi:hypothetical protein